MKHEMAILLDEDVAIDTVLDERYDLKEVDVMSVIIDNMEHLPPARLWRHL